jgi:gliding motility-associated transport system ATP-binding protein
VIKVEKLTKLYGETPAVDEVSFEVAEGEILGFLGPNGAGKTTTMRILAGYMPPTSGRASIAGFDVFSQSLEARKLVGYLPENVPLYPEMTVGSYLDYMAKLKGVPAKVRRNRIREVAERCRVADVFDSRLGKLSKGYRQRVGLAQAIVHDPKVLILDEPTVGLDPRQIHETRSLIRGLGGRHTVILSTHILPEVSMTCSRVLIINRGRIVAQDTPDNLTHRQAGGDRLELLVRGPMEDVRKRLRAVPGVLHIEMQHERDDQRVVLDCAPGNDRREEVARAVVEGGFGLRELRAVSLSLEDVFIQLVTRESSGGQAQTDGAGARPASPDARPREARPERRPARPGRKGGTSA